MADGLKVAIQPSPINDTNGGQRPECVDLMSLSTAVTFSDLNTQVMREIQTIERNPDSVFHLRTVLDRQKEFETSHGRFKEEQRLAGASLVGALSNLKELDKQIAECGFTGWLFSVKDNLEKQKQDQYNFAVECKRLADKFGYTGRQDAKGNPIFDDSLVDPAFKKQFQDTADKQLDVSYRSVELAKVFMGQALAREKLVAELGKQVGADIQKIDELQKQAKHFREEARKLIDQGYEVLYVDQRKHAREFAATLRKANERLDGCITSLNTAEFAIKCARDGSVMIAATMATGGAGAWYICLARGAVVGFSWGTGVNTLEVGSDLLRGKSWHDTFDSALERMKDDAKNASIAAIAGIAGKLPIRQALGRIGISRFARFTPRIPSALSQRLTFATSGLQTNMASSALNSAYDMSTGRQPVSIQTAGYSLVQDMVTGFVTPMAGNRFASQLDDAAIPVLRRLGLTGANQFIEGIVDSLATLGRNGLEGREMDAEQWSAIGVNVLIGLNVDHARVKQAARETRSFGKYIASHGLAAPAPAEHTAAPREHAHTDAVAIGGLNAVEKVKIVASVGPHRVAMVPVEAAWQRISGPRDPSLRPLDRIKEVGGALKTGAKKVAEVAGRAKETVDSLREHGVGPTIETISENRKKRGDAKPLDVPSRLAGFIREVGKGRHAGIDPTWEGKARYQVDRPVKQELAAEYRLLKTSDTRLGDLPTVPGVGETFSHNKQLYVVVDRTDLTITYVPAEKGSKVEIVGKQKVDDPRFEKLNYVPPEGEKFRLGKEQYKVTKVTATDIQFEKTSGGPVETAPLKSDFDARLKGATIPGTKGERFILPDGTEAIVVDSTGANKKVALLEAGGRHTTSQYELVSEGLTRYEKGQRKPETPGTDLGYRWEIDDPNFDARRLEEGFTIKDKSDNKYTVVEIDPINSTATIESTDGSGTRRTLGARTASDEFSFNWSVKDADFKGTRFITLEPDKIITDVDEKTYKVTKVDRETSTATVVRTDDPKDTRTLTAKKTHTPVDIYSFTLKYEIDGTTREVQVEGHVPRKRNEATGRVDVEDREAPRRIAKYLETVPFEILDSLKTTRTTTDSAGNTVTTTVPGRVVLYDSERLPTRIGSWLPDLDSPDLRGALHRNSPDTIHLFSDPKEAKGAYKERLAMGHETPRTVEVKQWTTEGAPLVHSIEFPLQRDIDGFSKIDFKDVEKYAGRRTVIKSDSGRKFMPEAVDHENFNIAGYWIDRPGEKVIIGSKPQTLDCHSYDFDITLADGSTHKIVQHIPVKPDGSADTTRLRRSRHSVLMTPSDILREINVRRANPGDPSLAERHMSWDPDLDSPYSRGDRRYRKWNPETQRWDGDADMFDSTPREFMRRARGKFRGSGRWNDDSDLDPRFRARIPRPNLTPFMRGDMKSFDKAPPSNLLPYRTLHGRYTREEYAKPMARRKASAPSGPTFKGGAKTHTAAGPSLYSMSVHQALADGSLRLPAELSMPEIITDSGSGGDNHDSGGADIGVDASTNSDLASGADNLPGTGEEVTRDLQSGGEVALAETDAAASTIGK